VKGGNIRQREGEARDNVSLVAETSVKIMARAKRPKRHIGIVKGKRSQRMGISLFLAIREDVPDLASQGGRDCLLYSHCFTATTYHIGDCRSCDSQIIRKVLVPHASQGQ